MEEQSNTEPEVKEQETKGPDLVSILKGLPGAPNQVTIDKWKAEFGSIYVSGLAEDELYVFRPIFRNEYKQIQIDNQKIATMEKPEQAISEQFNSEERIVSKCLLWPKRTPEELAIDKGGTVSTLLEAIMQNSNFMSPAQVSMLVMKL